VKKILSGIIMNLVNTIVERVHPYIPFTAWNTLWRNLDKRGQTILDLGCGGGAPMRFINRHKHFYCVGLDIYRPWLSDAKSHERHSDYVMCDIRKLPIEEKSFDIVLCLEALEHLTKEEGRQLLKDMETIARRQVIITTPVGKFPQHPALNDNPYEEHTSSWRPVEFGLYGYKVRGYGLPLFGGAHGLLARLPEPLRSVRRVIWLLASTISYFVPAVAGWMVCIKQIEHEDNRG